MTHKIQFKLRNAWTGRVDVEVYVLVMNTLILPLFPKLREGWANIWWKIALDTGRAIALDTMAHDSPLRGVRIQLPGQSPAAGLCQEAPMFIARAVRGQPSETSCTTRWQKDPSGPEHWLPTPLQHPFSLSSWPVTKNNRRAGAEQTLFLPVSYTVMLVEERRTGQH